MNAKLPYLPQGREILQVAGANEYMEKAQKVALTLSTDPVHPTGAVIVKAGQIIGWGANRSEFHKQFGCVRNFLRKFFRVPSGKMYWTCHGCSPRYHAEQTAIRDAKSKGQETKGADLYLWGHWWCCESCWARMIEAGIDNVYLVEGARDKFEK